MKFETGKEDIRDGAYPAEFVDALTRSGCLAGSF